MTETALAELEHEVLSAEFIEWAREVGDLNHPASCHRCRMEVDREHLRRLAAIAEGDPEVARMNAEIEYYGALNARLEGTT